MPQQIFFNNMNDKSKFLILDYFSGGVPSGEYFRLMVDGLVKLLNEHAEELGNPLPTLSYIGLLAYFEAFCKDHFASLINIYPELISNLKKGNQDISIDANKFFQHSIESGRRIGFLLSEKYDFGTAQKINALYKALINVTPFSKDETKEYSKILTDRNLIIHHGGIFTSWYLEQRPTLDLPEQHRVFMDSIEVNSNRVKSDSKFLLAIARKTVRTTHEALSRYLDKGIVSPAGKKMKSILFMLRWWGNEGA